MRLFLKRQCGEIPAGAIPEFVAMYAAPEVAAAIRAAGGGIRIDFLDYDWKLNAGTRGV